MQASLEERGRQTELDGASLSANMPVDLLMHRRISATGRWLAGKSVFLDNRQMNGKIGFLVVTPLQLDGSPLAVMVQRGWVPRNFVERAQIPKIDTPGGAVQVAGLLVPAPSKLYELGHPVAGKSACRWCRCRFSKRGHPATACCVTGPSPTWVSTRTWATHFNGSGSVP
jgi:surfeit locus 1 family protein